MIEAIASRAIGGGLSVQPVSDGRSTFVYRLKRGSEVFYLRVLPEVGDSFAPETDVHATVRRLGVRVPEIVYCEDRNPDIGLSIMITTALRGLPVALSGESAALPIILLEAGRDLALINSVRVDGFGWIRRDRVRGAPLAAEPSTERVFMLGEVRDGLARIPGDVLPAHTIRRTEQEVERHAGLFDAPQGRLAHGDFDATHIFAERGRYTGIIDLGEIRGTGPYYDLGHFHFHDEETVPIRLLPDLLAGYAEVTPLPEDANLRLALSSLIIGVGFLARAHCRLPAAALDRAVRSVLAVLDSLEVG